ncbi:hypothetical protein [Streptomyces sp. NPDC053560]|uniref:hypothetical protein n=1 Tax=Streptomyces sp. NPDC053560 TaxID=3365711 RepID=UPI0037D65898
MRAFKGNTIFDRLVAAVAALLAGAFIALFLLAAVGALDSPKGTKPASPTYDDPFWPPQPIPTPPAPPPPPLTVYR